MASFRITRVFTRSGDDGTTGLLDNTRVSKADPRVQAYGDIDEACSAIGFARSLLTQDFSDISEELCSIQQELFDLGAELAAPAVDNIARDLLISIAEIQRLEQLCDRYGAELAPLESFVLPGTDSISAALHLARAVTRRAERSIMAFREDGQGALRDEVLQYVNRLSDLLYVYSRVVETQAEGDIRYWIKPGERK